MIRTDITLPPWFYNIQYIINIIDSERDSFLSKSGMGVGEYDYIVPRTYTTSKKSTKESINIYK